jgi:uncharacterized protein (DUF1697 family)
MPTRILFVRAVNVGGAKLPMAEFRELLTSLGASAVRTYIASGNAVLSLDGDPAGFDRAVEAEITARYGYAREVISRSPAEVREALAAHPFAVVEPKYSYVTFLTATPAPTSIQAALAVPTGDDRWKLVGAELHLRYESGQGAASLNLDALLRELGVKGTARNLRTVRAVLDLAE